MRNPWQGRGSPWTYLKRQSGKPRLKEVQRRPDNSGVGEGSRLACFHFALVQVLLLHPPTCWGSSRRPHKVRLRCGLSQDDLHRRPVSDRKPRSTPPPAET